MLRTACPNISVITNFGCRANCWYCIWKGHELEKVNDEIGAIDDNENRLYKKDVLEKCFELAGGADNWNLIEEDFPDKYKIKIQAEGKIEVPWTKRIEKRKNLIEEYAKKHDLYNKANPNCCSCKGTGIYRSSYNKNSKWSWWQIGGRWSGLFDRL